MKEFSVVADFGLHCDYKYTSLLLVGLGVELEELEECYGLKELNTF